MLFIVGQKVHKHKDLVGQIVHPVLNNQHDFYCLTFTLSRAPPKKSNLAKIVCLKIWNWDEKSETELFIEQDTKISSQKRPYFGGIRFFLSLRQIIGSISYQYCTVGFGFCQNHFCKSWLFFAKFWNWSSYIFTW